MLLGVVGGVQVAEEHTRADLTGILPSGTVWPGAEAQRSGQTLSEGVSVHLKKSLQ